MRRLTNHNMVLQMALGTFKERLMVCCRQWQQALQQERDTFAKSRRRSVHEAGPGGGISSARRVQYSLAEVVEYLARRLSIELYTRCISERLARQVPVTGDVIPGISTICTWSVSPDTVLQIGSEGRTERSAPILEIRRSRRRS